MSPRPFVRFPLAALLGSLVLHGCEPMDGTSDVPPGGPPPEGFATAMIETHNAVRASATPTPSPALAPLLWSPTVATTAQAWADGCRYEHNTAVLHDLGYGENIAATAPAGVRDAAYVVELWASEDAFYDLAANTCNTANPPNPWGTCGHYTQIVWRSTSVLGCAVRTCTTGSPFGESFPTWDYWVCDYAPPGNYVGQRPY